MDLVCCVKQSCWKAASLHSCKQLIHWLTKELCAQVDSRVFRCIQSLASARLWGHRWAVAWCRRWKVVLGLGERVQWWVTDLQLKSIFRKCVQHLQISCTSVAWNLGRTLMQAWSGASPSWLCATSAWKKQAECGLGDFSGFRMVVLFCVMLLPPVAQTWLPETERMPCPGWFCRGCLPDRFCVLLLTERIYRICTIFNASWVDPINLSFR